MARFDLPTVPELLALGAPRDYAVTIYAQAEPSDPDLARTTVKSAMDRAIRGIRDGAVGEGSAGHRIEEEFRRRGSEVLADPAWQTLSRSVAIFATPTDVEMFVLPNRLENQVQVSRYFDVGQLVRAVATPQTAFALTLSAHGWNLWRATGNEQVAEMDIDADGIGDVTEATNRATVRGRIHARRLHGDEGTKSLLEMYAKRVHEAVGHAMDSADPTGRQPLFLFAADPLADIYSALHGRARDLVVIHGSPDELTAPQIDGPMRRGIDEINSRRAAETVDRIADGTARGLVATDLVDIARAAVAADVDTLVYDFTVDVLGVLDDATGEVDYTDDGYDLFSRVAVKVLETGGSVIPIRSAEIVSDQWNQMAAARLRFPLST
ncbi:hypothetical protein [Gordonia shandongensis]|uniref:baeRF11 domain-containing protein n=1 Tax=Gordonia shandongensis TaxID=376351 RepID=UPI000419DF27|nr:hypothetical protein [Gordonia shandongensis]